MAMPPSPRAAGGGFHDPFDIFREVFGSAAAAAEFSKHFSAAAAGAQADGSQRGTDLRYDMQITLEEAAFGVEKEIEVRKLDACDKCHGSGAAPGSRAVTCPTCRGRGQVVSSRGFFQVSQTCPRCRGLGEVIEKPCDACDGEGSGRENQPDQNQNPGRIADGSRLRSTSNGEAGIRGGGQGDLYIVVHVKEHPIFQREDDNLFCEVPISFAIAALGGEVPVPTLEGKASLKVPAGTQSGQSFKLRGKGVVHVNSRDRGDLYARLLVEVPTA